MEYSGASYRVRSAEPAKDVVRPPESLINEWRAKDTAAYQAQQSISARKRLESHNGDLSGMTLGELRQTIYNSGPAQRVGLMAAVIKYLGFSPPRKDER